MLNKIRINIFFFINLSLEWEIVWNIVKIFIFFFQFWKLSKSYVQDTFIIMLYLFFVKLSYRWVVIVKFKLVDVKSTCICYDWQVERKAVFKFNNKKKIKKYVVICFAIEALSDCSLLPVIGLGLGLWCLIPLSTINWNRQEETTDLPQVTDKLLSHLYCIE